MCAVDATRRSARQVELAADRLSQAIDSRLPPELVGTRRAIEQAFSGATESCVPPEMLEILATLKETRP